MLAYATLLLVVAGFVEVAVVLFSSGASPFQFLSLEKLAEISAANRSAYGYGSESQPLLERLLFPLVYAAPLFGGTLFRVASSRWHKWVGLGSPVVATLVGMLYGSRMGVLFGGGFWLAAFLATDVFTRPQRRQIGVTILALALGVLAVSVGVMLVRYGQVAEFQLGLIREHLTDPFGFIAAFASWFDNGHYLTDGPLFGHMTFGRIYELFISQLHDTHADYQGSTAYFYYEIDVGFTSSNIFTVFRGLIDDFGMIGALAFILLLGVGGGFSYRRTLDGDVRYLPMLVVFYAFVFISIAFSVFTYVTPGAALVLFALYMASPRFRLQRVAPSST